MVLRLTRDKMLMEVAYVIAKRGTCSRLQVGTVISRNGRIISTGYNGTPKGLPHCNHSQDEPGEGCKSAEHAERNAIIYAARHGVELEGSEIYITHMPCLECARAIVGAGIQTVYYQMPYRLTKGVELLKAAGIEVVCLASQK